MIEIVFGLDAPYDVYIHDYVWVCPRITLIGAENLYCGEPGLKACETCLKTEGGRLEADLTVRALRSRSARWLTGARRVVAPAQDVAVRLHRYFPKLPIEVRAWEQIPFVGAPGARPHRDVIRVAVIGAIGDHKGYEVLLACAKDAAERALPVEFVVIGFSQDDEPLWATGKVFITGEYEESEIGDLVAREAPDLCFFPSVWPETWCYCLSHALRAGLPTAAFDLGAIAERLEGDLADHVLLPLNTPAREINDRLLQMGGPRAAAPHLQVPATSALGSQTISQVGPIEAYGARAQSQSAILAASKLEPAGKVMQQSQSGLIVSGEILPLNTGIYRFYVESAAPTRVGDNEDLFLPAIHIGPGPGVAPEDIEVMSGLGHKGDWLYETQDLMVIKIKATSALILVTSVRSEGMSTLEVSVERIDTKTSVGARPHPAIPPSVAPPVDAAPGETAVIMEDRRKDEQDASLVRARILVHVRRRGDLTFDDQNWAGVLGEDLPIEAFSIAPLEGISSDQIEFKALTATGVETPWTAGGVLCGTRGMAVPLVGFAVRLTGDAKALYECEYRGAFRSGKIVGPISNGGPCRAVAADDYLEGIQLKIIDRAKAAAPSVQKLSEEAASPTRSETDVAAIGPRFSVFRERAQ